MSPDEVIEADEVIEVDVTGKHPVPHEDVDLTRRTEDVVLVEHDVAGEGAMVLVEPAGPFGRLDPEWIDRGVAERQPPEPKVRFGRLDPEWIEPGR